MERYCSSYYDKHGLYNDGFPCPADKYCCQGDDGAKMCCAIGGAGLKADEAPPAKEPPPRQHHHHNNRHHSNRISNSNSPSAEVKVDPSSFRSHMLTTMQSNLRQQQQQQQLVKLANYEHQDQYGGALRPAQNSLGSIDPASPAVYGGAATVPFLLSK